MLSEAEINALVHQIVHRICPDKVIVFGSYAKGTATYKSDLDLFVIKDTPLPRQGRNGDVKSLLANFLIKVDVHIYTPEEVEEYGAEEYSFVNSILRTGKVVYEKETCG